MAGYVVATIAIHDEALYQQYSDAGQNSARPFGGSGVIYSRSFETFEGDAPYTLLVVLAFPTVAAARAWYHSEAYQAIVPIRRAAASSTFVIVEGRDLPAFGVGHDVDVDIAGGSNQFVDDRSAK